MAKVKKYNTKKAMNSSYDRLLNYTLVDNNELDDQMLTVADAILGNCPVLISFDEVKDINKCNHVLSFLSGVIYSIGGECYCTSKESYLIASDEAFKDGTLHKWIKEFGYTLDE